MNRLLLGNQNIERIIFGGNLRLAHAVHNMLHPKVGEGVIALMNLPYDMKDFDIVAQIADVATGFERENDPQRHPSDPDGV